jgi:gas vesicle protein
MASIPTQGQAPGGTSSAAASESSGVTDQAQEKAQELAGQASEQAKQAAGQAKDRVREQLDQRSTQAGEQVAGQAGDIRSVAEQLREQGKDKPAELAEQAADRVERVGSYLRDNDADRILGDVEDFARQRPWLVIAGGIALGFAASRFVKASSQDRYHSRDQLTSTATRAAHTTQPPAGPRTGAPLRPTGNGGPAETIDGPPTSTGAL